MQNVEGTGDFEHYQGIWRLQRLPNCAPDGGDACRLTYAVEIRPKGFLPVSLIEGRIASDLKNNLDAIRVYVETQYGRNAPEAKAVTVKEEIEMEEEEPDSALQVAAEAVTVLAEPEYVTGPPALQVEGAEDRVELESVISAIKLRR